MNTRLQPSGSQKTAGDGALEATSPWRGMTVLTKGLGLFGLALTFATAFADVAHAGELRKIGHTSISLELDDRFLGLDDGNGYTVPRTAIVQAFEFPDLALGALDDYIDGYISSNFPGAAVVKEPLEVGVRKYTMVTADSQTDGIPMRRWVVYGGPRPTLWIKFTQVLSTGTVPVFNKDVVLRLLTSAVFEDATFASQLNAAGWSMVLEAPFLSGQATRNSDRFIAMVSDQPDFKGRLELALVVDHVVAPPRLDDAGKDLVANADWSTATVRATRFAGSPGQRRSVIHRNENGEIVQVIQYVTAIGDEVVTLIAEGPQDLFDNNVISVVDRIATSVSRTKSHS